MKWWHGLIIGLILGSVAAGVLVYFLSRCTIDPGGLVVITDPGKTGPTEPNKPGEKVNTDCGNIWIEGSIIAGNRFGVMAGDGYNHAERIFSLGVITPPKRWHVIQLAYAPVIDLTSKQFRHSVDAMYFYSWEHIAIGTGAMAVFDKTQLYEAKRYNLQYKAAYSASAEAEPLPHNIFDLAEQIKRMNAPYIFHEGLIAPRLAQTIARETDAGLLKLNSGHNIGKDDIKKGATFLSLMENNLDNLKKGLSCP